MQFSGRHKFLGAEKRVGFNDPSKPYYIAGIGSGFDTLRVYIEPEQYGAWASIPPYTDVDVVMDFNPANQKSPWKMVALEPCE